MQNIRISSSGIRGKVPEGLNINIASDFASAFSTYLGEGKRVGVSIDGRNSGFLLSDAILSSLSATGSHVCFYKIMPTPILQFLIKERQIDAGISITGGHNPSEWNALLLLDENGFYLNSIESNEVFNIYHSKEFSKKSWDKIGKIKYIDAKLDDYLKKLSLFVDVESIRKKNYKIVFDLSNGAVAKVIEKIGDFFNIESILLNNESLGRFAHNPEPNPENASQVSSILRNFSFNAGFVFNSDGSRVSIVDEKGEAFSEEYTLPFVAKAFLSKKISPIITTVSTSMMIDYIAQQFGVSVFRTKVGQSSVTHTMEAKDFILGGEGSGSVCIREFSNGYDSILSFLLILEFMSIENKTISEIKKEIPEYFIIKYKVPVTPGKMYGIIHKLKERFKKEKLDLRDGIFIKRKKGWFNIRVSTTEFILRIIVEAEDEKTALKFKDEIDEKIWSIL